MNKKKSDLVEKKRVTGRQRERLKNKYESKGEVLEKKERKENEIRKSKGTNDKGRGREGKVVRERR